MICSISQKLVHFPQVGSRNPSPFPDPQRSLVEPYQFDFAIASHTVTPTINRKHRPPCWRSPTCRGLRPPYLRSLTMMRKSRSSAQTSSSSLLVKVFRPSSVIEDGLKSANRLAYIQVQCG